MAADNESNVFTKAIGAVEWFGVDWSDRLVGDALWAADTIATSDWTVPAGLAEEDDLQTSAAAGVKLSGSAAGKYNVVNEITTAVNGETLIQVLEICVR
jgi:hypothetical protein